MAIENKTIHELPAIASPDGSEEMAAYDGVDLGRVTLTQVANFGGDVTGPASATDNAIARFDLTTGKLIQNSGVTIDDSGNIATSGTIDGRDVSADGSKLDGIEAGATAADGDVVGPGSSTDNAVARFDTTTGKLIQNSDVTIDDSGNITMTGDINDGGGGLFARQTRISGVTPDDNFRSGTIPSGYSWVSGSGFNGTPSTLDYDYVDDWLQVLTASGPYFLAQSISNIGSNLSSYGLFIPNNAGGIGWRVDDGTSSNYYQCIASALSGLVTLTLTESGGAGASYGPFLAQGPLMLQFLSQYSGGSHRMLVYFATLLGNHGNILAGTYDAVSGWAGSGWRSGIVTSAVGGYAYCDWFNDER
jgi:hypothetical protein